MALARFQNLPKQQQNEILKKAAEWFATYGYSGGSYNELLRELGMGKSQAYYYFADKADLFITAVAACYERYYEQAAKIALPQSAEEFWDYVRALTLLGFDYQSVDPIASKLTRAAITSDVRFRIADAILTTEGSSRGQHASWVRLGQSLGAVRLDLEPELLVRLSLEFANFVDGFYAERAESTPPEERRRYAGIFTDLTRRLFEPRTKPASAPPDSPKARQRRRTRS